MRPDARVRSAVPFLRPFVPSGPLSARRFNAGSTVVRCDSSARRAMIVRTGSMRTSEGKSLKFFVVGVVVGGPPVLILDATPVACEVGFFYVFVGGAPLTS